MHATRGTVLTSAYSLPTASSIQGSVALTRGWLLFVNHSRAELPRDSTVREEDWGFLDETYTEAGVGTHPRANRRVTTQLLFGLGRGRTDGAFQSNTYNVVVPEYRARGSYYRLYAQRSSVWNSRYLDVGASARLSAVHFDDYRRFASDRPTSSTVVYTRDTSFTGSLTGVFLEPAILLAAGIPEVRLGTQLSLAFPLRETAFGHHPIGVMWTLGVSLPLGRRDPSR